MKLQLSGARYFVLVLFLVTTLRVRAGAGDSIFISGSLSDDRIINKEIKFSYYEAYSSEALWPAKSSRIVTVDSSMNFSFSITGVTRLGYLRVIFPVPYESDEIINIPILVKAGDKLTIGFRNNRICFLGRDADKYNIQLDIGAVKVKLKGTLGSADSMFLKQLSMGYERLIADQLWVLDLHKDNLDRQFYDILATNVKYKSRISILSFMNHYVTDSDSISGANARIFLENYFTNFIKDTLSSEIALNSPYFIDYLYYVEYLKCSFEKNSEYSFFRLFNQIDKKYLGVIKDRVLLTAVLSPSPSLKRDNTEKYYNLLYSKSNDPFAKELLKDQMGVLGKGKLAYPFQLKDTSGRVVSLSDFRGRLVVLDFYFTGCSGCAALSRSMDPIFIKFGHNPNIAFISINLDRKLEMFKAAVRSQVYTHPESVNLYTNGSGENHPLVNYYKIVGCPVLLVIDKEGLILDGNPPFPSLSDEQQTTAFTNLILENL